MLFLFVLFGSMFALPLSDNGCRADKLGNTKSIASLNRSRTIADFIKDKAANAGHAVADTTVNAGNKPGQGVMQTKECGTEKTGLGGPKECTNAGVAGIKERMDVIASCGKKVGVVDHIEGETIKLTKNDSPDSQHHFIPTGWVDHVDSHVHLKKNSMETEKGWKSDAASCSACGA